MAQPEHLAESDLLGLRLVKKISGERIREERRRRGIKQGELADEMGVSLRWLREIEAGNPGAKLDDHLNGTIRLGLSAGHIVLPILFMAQRMPVPQTLLHTDLRPLERACVDLVADAAIKSVTAELRPSWWSED
nr:helix-turn-helix domain-containing protein [Sandaracinobacteroides sayramensis]